MQLFNMRGRLIRAKLISVFRIEGRIHTAQLTSYLTEGF